MYTNVQSIQDSIQDSKEVTHKKVVHTKLFPSITCNGTKHTTEFICLRLFIFMS